MNGFSLALQALKMMNINYGDAIQQLLHHAIGYIAKENDLELSKVRTLIVWHEDKMLCHIVDEKTKKTLATYTASQLNDLIKRNV
jgi:hypothetical protein